VSNRTRSHSQSVRVFAYARRVRRHPSTGNRDGAATGGRESVACWAPKAREGRASARPGKQMLAPPANRLRRSELFGLSGRWGSGTVWEN